MTDREHEILKIIMEEPMISQEALANRLNIQRSSVAVHISNLIKKGKILGKGYIVNQEAYAVVIGGCNMDIAGKCANPMILHDSNVGFVSTSTGGVGRNIAENLARLGVSVKMISAVGADEFGNVILEELKQLKVDTEGILVHQSHRTSTYLAVSDETGDMHVAISQMGIVDEISIAYLEQFDMTIEHATCIVLDTNLKEEVLQYLISKYNHKKIFVDTVSTTKAIKVKALLDKIYFVKPNLLEANLLIGREAAESGEANLELLHEVAEALKARKVVISLGSGGVFGAFEDKALRMETPEVQIVNTTGAGDAFMAGMVYAEIKDMPFEKAVKFGMACSIHNIEQRDTVSKALTDSTISQLIEERM